MRNRRTADPENRQDAKSAKSAKPREVTGDSANLMGAPSTGASSSDQKVLLLRLLLREAWWFINGVFSGAFLARVLTTAALGGLGDLGVLAVLELSDGVRCS